MEAPVLSCSGQRASPLLPELPLVSLKVLVAVVGKEISEGSPCGGNIFPPAPSSPALALPAVPVFTVERALPHLPGGLE